MNRRSVMGFGSVSRLLAKMNSEVPAWLILGFIAAYVTVAALAAHRSQETRRLASMGRHDSEGKAARSNSNDLLRILPGVVQPPVVDPPNVPWKDEEEVVGVTVNGQSRAYLVEALSRPDYHVINDLIGLVPVSITYCNINRCARAFTQEGAKRPLDIAIGGQHNLRELLLMVNGGTVPSGQPPALRARRWLRLLPLPTRPFDRHNLGKVEEASPRHPSVGATPGPVNAAAPPSRLPVKLRVVVGKVS